MRGENGLVEVSFGKVVCRKVSPPLIRPPINLPGSQILALPNKARVFLQRTPVRRVQARLLLNLNQDWLQPTESGKALFYVGS